MKRFWSLATLVALCGGLVGQADEPAKPAAEKKATFSITGLHCPPCTQTVESSLKKVPGVKSAKVDWDTKSAKLQFDESTVTVQGIASAIAATPHMMGAGMSYGSLLALSVPEVRDNASAAKAKDALAKVKGVTKVSAFPARHTVSVQLATGKDVTTQALIEALGAVDMKASTY
jgi:copper chaperone CopZ